MRVFFFLYIKKPWVRYLPVLANRLYDVWDDISAITKPLLHALKMAAAPPAIMSTSRQKEGKAKWAVGIFSSRKHKVSLHRFLSVNFPWYLIGQDKVPGQVLRYKGIWTGDRAAMISLVMIGCQAPSWVSVSKKGRGMALDKQIVFANILNERIRVLAFRNLLSRGGGRGKGGEGHWWRETQWLQSTS